MGLHPANPTVILFVTSLALYFGVVYTLAVSQHAPAARYAIHTAILLMDALLALQLISKRAVPLRAFRHGEHQQVDHRRWPWLLAATLLACVVLLHVDYGIARIRDVANGLSGSLVTLKTYLLASQLASIAMLASLGNLAAAREATPQPRRRSGSDLAVFSILLVPLVNYLAHNHELFSVPSAVEYLAVFLSIPLGAYLVVDVWRREAGAPALTAPLIATLAFVHYSMPMVSSALRQPIETLFPVHAGLAVLLPAAVVAAYRKNQESTAAVLIGVAICSMGASVVQAAFGNAQGEQVPHTTHAGVDESEGRDSRLIAALSVPAVRRPDVYLLVYDGYAPAALMDEYGIDDEGTDQFLIRNGFKLYERAYSLFMASAPSISSLLDMRTDPKARIGEPTTALTFFKEHGYDTHLVLNSYLLQGTRRPGPDFTFPRSGRRWGLESLYRGIAVGEFKAEIVFQDVDRGDWLLAKRAVLQAKAGPPRMLYAHSGFPNHSQNSGSCLPDEVARYARRLEVARDEIVQDVAAIRRSSRPAIVIIAGDHGPYLTGDCLELAGYREEDVSRLHLADRYAVKLAVRWPERLPELQDRISVLQDVFFAVAAYISGDGRVWDHRLSTATVGAGGIPSGAVKDGIVMVGKDEGQPLLPP